MWKRNSPLPRYTHSKPASIAWLLSCLGRPHWNWNVLSSPPTKAPYDAFKTAVLELLNPRHNVSTAATIFEPETLCPPETSSGAQPSFPLPLPTTASQHQDLMACSCSGTRNEGQLSPGASKIEPSSILTVSPVTPSSTPTMLPIALSQPVVLRTRKTSRYRKH